MSAGERRAAISSRAIDRETIDECVRCLSQPGALRATLGYSRALYQDAADNRLAIARVKLTLPVLAMGGDHAVGEGLGQAMKLVADRVETDVIPNCGHWASEEQPQWVSERLLRFLRENG